MGLEDVFTPYENSGVHPSALTESQTIGDDGESWLHRTWGTQALGINISWKDLRVTVPGRKKSFWPPWPCQRDEQSEKVILDGLTGCAIPGTLLAIMGASGAGKSTFLNCLSRRNTSQLNVTGEILVNGEPLEKQHRNVMAYLQQNDLLFKSLTVREHLHFHARLRMDASTTKHERKKRIESLLYELGLKKCEKTMIGEPLQEKSISGGERKRLAFATEILTDPPVIFCDEPTTGLDSFMAQSVVSMLYKMAGKGKTIVCTIHQPSSKVFAMFDRLLLLTEGKTAYLGSTYEALDFFTDIGHTCPITFNPADYYVHLLAIHPGYEQQDRQVSEHICEKFKSSVYYQEVDSLIENISRSQYLMVFDQQSQNTLKQPKAKKVSWFVQFNFLLWRSLLQSFRNPSVMKIRTFQKIFLALMIGLVYFGVRLNQEGVTALTGVIFVFITENTFPSMYGVLQIFPRELPVILRENQNGLYRIDAYYLSKILSLIPGFLFEPTLFTVICYWMIGFHENFSRFLVTTAVLILTANTASSCGCFFSTAFENFSMALAILIPFDIILMVTGGIFVRLITLPSYIAWTQYLSWFRYAYEAIMITQWNGVTNITCDETPASLCVGTGQEVLEDFGFKEEHLVWDVLLLIVIYTGFHILGFLALLIRSYRS